MRSPARPPPRREVQRQFWRLIARGLSSEDTAVACGVAPPVGSRWFRHGGGIPPISLAESSDRFLSFAEREEIALVHVQKLGVRGIVRQLRRAPSTISRELRRNRPPAAARSTTGPVAQWKAERAARRPKTAKLAGNHRLRRYVQDRLAGAVTAADGTPVPGPTVPWKGRRHGQRQDRRWATAWSPEQITRRLPVSSARRRRWAGYASPRLGGWRGRSRR